MYLKKYSLSSPLKHLALASENFANRNYYVPLEVLFLFLDDDYLSLGVCTCRWKGIFEWKENFVNVNVIVNVIIDIDIHGNVIVNIDINAIVNIDINAIVNIDVNVIMNIDINTNLSIIVNVILL